MNFEIMTAEQCKELWEQCRNDDDLKLRVYIQCNLLDACLRSSSYADFVSSPQNELAESFCKSKGYQVLNNPRRITWDGRVDGQVEIESVGVHEDHVSVKVSGWEPFAIAGDDLAKLRKAIAAPAIGGNHWIPDDWNGKVEFVETLIQIHTQDHEEGMLVHCNKPCRDYISRNGEWVLLR